MAITEGAATGPQFGRQIVFTTDDAQADELHAMVRQFGRSRAHVLRAVIDAGLASGRKALEREAKLASRARAGRG